MELELQLSSLCGVTKICVGCTNKGLLVIKIPLKNSVETLEGIQNTRNYCSMQFALFHGIPTSSVVMTTVCCQATHFLDNYCDLTYFEGSDNNGS